MAYAYCPRCLRSIRYKASAPGGPAWLKELATALGRAETALFLCPSCWLVPEVGDLVAVLEPPSGDATIKRGSVGRVVEVENEGIESEAPSPGRFVVEFAGESGNGTMQHSYSRNQLQAAGVEFGGTIPVTLTLPSNEAAQ